MYDVSMRPIDVDGDETGIEITVNSVTASYEAIRVHIIDEDEGTETCIPLTSDEAKRLVDYLLAAVSEARA